jgi:hypothetical protein
MTQVEFAAALSVAPTSIHRWEAGTSSPEFEMVVSLWSLAIERGSSTSKQFAQFLLSRTEAIRPLFAAKELPEIKALDKEIATLPVEQRQLAFAFIRMMKHNTDETIDKVIRALLERWKEVRSHKQESTHHSPRKAGKPSGQKH